MTLTRREIEAIEKLAEHRTIEAERNPQVTTQPKDTQMKSDDTYQLPPELAVAFETGRVEFVSLLRKQVANGRELPQPQIVDLLRLVEHMIVDKQTTKQRMAEVEHVLRFMDDAAKGLYKKSAEARAILRGTSMPDDAEE